MRRNDPYHTPLPKGEIRALAACAAASILIVSLLVLPLARMVAQ